MNQARLDEMAYQRQRQEKQEWQQSYDKGMDEHANKYVFDLYRGNDTGGVDPSVIARVDPTKIMKIDEMRREQQWRDNTFGPTPGSTGMPSPSDPLAPKRSTGAAGGLDFTGAATAAGAPELAGFLPSVVQAESGGNPNAKASTSSARGLGQFTAATRDAIMGKYGVDAWSSDPNEQLKALAYLAKDNRDGLASSLGLSPDKVTPQQIYMANFLGQAGANTFLKGMQTDPNAPAVSLVSPEAAKANASIFYRQDNTPRTAQEVFDLMGNKVVAQAGQRTMSDASGPPPGVSQQGQGGYGGIINKALKLPVAEFTQWVMGAPKADREWLIGLYKQANPEAPSGVKEFESVYGRRPNSPEEYRQFKKGESAGGSAFEGTGMDQQSWSIVNSIGPKIQDGTATPDEQRRYMSAEAHLTTPKVSTDPSTGAQTVMQLDLGQFGFPSLRKQAQQAQQPQQGGTGLQQPQTGYTSTQTTQPKVPEDVRKGLTAVDDILESIDALSKETSNGSVLDNKIPFTERKGRAGSAYTLLQMRLKEALNLGVLNGPDLMILEKMLQDPTSMTAGWSKDSMKGGMDVVRDMFQKKKQSLLATNPGSDRYQRAQGSSGSWDAPDLKSKYGLE